MRVFRLLAIIIIVVFSMPTTAAAHLSQNIRQGPQPVFAISCPGEAHVKSDGQQRQALFSSDFVSEPLFMLDDALGSTIALTNHSGNLLARMNYDPWGNLWWPRKQAFHAPPCHKNQLANFLDRFRGHILGKAQHDPWRLGYHYAKVLTPYLYTGRKFDTTTQTYFNRWRQYNPKAGRFLSSDPIGFNGENNLYGYANQNPLIYTDPYGLMPWGEAQKKGIDFADWFKRPDTTDCDQIGYEGAYTDYLESMAFQQPGSAEFEFLLGILSAKDLIVKGGSYTWEELKAILRSRKGATDLFSGRSGKVAEELIPGSLKRSASYAEELARKTLPELEKMAQGGGELGKKAQQMLKLIKQAKRLLEKNKG